MGSIPEPRPAQSGAGARLALLLLLPGAVLAWPGPGAPLAGDPFPDLAGAGIAALALVPSALVLLAAAGSARPRALLPWALGWTVGLLALVTGRVTDTFEARRALVLAAACAAAFAAGSALGERGKRVLARGLVALSLAWSSWALLRAVFYDPEDLGGVLGNVASVSQAALPGAAAGAWIAASERGRWRAAGVLAVAAFAAHAAAAPVLAGAVSLAVALAWGAVRGPAQRRGLALAAVVALLSFGGARLFARVGEHGGNAGDPLALSGDVGGVEVRARIWRRVPAMLAASPLLGAGPGQFQAAFPPF